MADLDLTEAVWAAERVRLGSGCDCDVCDQMPPATLEHDAAVSIIDAVTPYIAAQVRAQIAADIEALDGEPLLKGLVSINRSAQAALEWAAATARGES